MRVRSIANLCYISIKRPAHCWSWVQFTGVGNEGSQLPRFPQQTRSGCGGWSDHLTPGRLHYGPNRLEGSKGPKIADPIHYVAKPCGSLTSWPRINRATLQQNRRPAFSLSNNGYQLRVRVRSPIANMYGSCNIWELNNPLDVIWQIGAVSC